MTSITRTLTLSLAIAAVAVFLIALGLVVGLEMVQDRLESRCETATAFVANAVAYDASGSLIVRSTASLRGLAARGHDFWYVVSQAGHVVESDPGHRPDLPFALNYSGPIGRSIVDTAGRKGSFCLDVKQVGASKLVVMVSGAHVTFWQFAKVFISRQAASVLFIAVGFAALAALGAALSSRFVGRSIARVTRLALAIDPTAPRASIPLDTVPIELVALVTALNRAFHEINQQMSRQRRFIGNAAHELRTPLTLLRAKIDEISDTRLRAELVQDIRRLASLVSAMLDLATLQGHVVEKRPVDLTALTTDVLADMAPSALDNGVELSLETANDTTVVVLGVEAALRSAIANLIGNAMLHAKGATSIVTVLDRDGITIRDDGAGLPPELAQSVLEPFQRGEGSKGAAGLGLSIVNEIMAAHGGSLRVASAPGHGTSIRLRFLDGMPEPVK